MSNTPLSSIIQRVERSLYEAIRLELVDKGYCPDIADTVTFPDNPAGVIAYNAALGTIVTNKGFAIEVFGVGSNFKKYETKIPRIVILEEQRLPGDLGGSPHLTYTFIPPVNPQDSGTYDSSVLPPQTSDFIYSIGLVYGSAVENRILHQILALALPKRGYINYYDNPTGKEKIFVKHTGFSEMSYDNKGYREASYLYQVSDLFETENTPIRTGISPIHEIRVDIRTDSPVQPSPDDTIKVP